MTITHELKEGNPYFDVTIGSYNGAEVCDLLGLYLLMNQKWIYNEQNKEKNYCTVQILGTVYYSPHKIDKKNKLLDVPFILEK